MRLKTQILVTGLLLLLSVGVSNTFAQDFAEEHDATIALDWMRLLYELVRDENANAPEAARLYGYAGVALYEAVYSGIPGNFSVGGQLERLPVLPFPDELLGL